MNAWKWSIWAGVVCLVCGGLAQLTQYLVTPISPSMDAATAVAAAASHLGAMRWALALDLPLLLVIPACIYIGLVAGMGTSRLAASGTMLTFGSLLAGVFLLGPDVLFYEAGRQSDLNALVAVIDAYQSNSVVLIALVLHLVGQTVGFVLLGASLWRSRAIPAWAALALALSPVVEFVGVGSGAKVVGALGYGLALISFVVCASVLRRWSVVGDTTPVPAELAVQHAGG